MPLRWWVDIANAPHVTLFRPVIHELRRLGDEVIITSWDRGQTGALAEATWPEARLVGDVGFRARVLAKGTAVISRARALIHEIGDERPLIALGHNSYAQLIAAKALRVPSITMMDYEHQPANHLAFRLADIVILPKAITDTSLRRYGRLPGHVLRYTGTKEEIALADFQPEPHFRARLGVSEEELMAVVRPAAEGALYHRHRNTLCQAAIDRLTSSGTTVLLSPRTESQSRRFSKHEVRVLNEPVSGPDLLYYADLVIGAGGTMTREAAVLGTPTFSIFEGRIGAVDRVLASIGRMRLVASPNDLPAGQRLMRLDPLSGNRERLDELIGLLKEPAISALNPVRRRAMSLRH